MMQPADGNGELVTNFAAHRRLFRELEVVGVRGASSADETGLRAHKPQVITIALEHWLADGYRSAGRTPERLMRLGGSGKHGCHKAELVQLRHKGHFDFLRSFFRQLVLEREHPMRPRGKSLRVAKLRQFSH